MPRKPRVGVGLEPFILRSALRRHLARAGFEVFYPRGDDVSDGASWPRADAVIVSNPVDLPEALVMVVSSDTETVEVRRGTRARREPYRGLEWLASLLSRELR